MCCSIADGRLRVPEEGVGIFDKLWSFFSPANEAITLAQLAEGLAAVCGSDVKTRRSVLYEMMSGGMSGGSLRCDWI